MERNTTVHDQWAAQVLRASIFLRSNWGGATLWRDLVGEEPDSDENRPRDAQRNQSGRWRESVLEAVVGPGRIDIMQSPLITPASPVTLDNFLTALPPFEEMVATWLEKNRLEYIRLAVGAVLVMACPTREETYEVLGRYVPSVKFDPANSREPLYRVNRPKRSVAYEGELNRITTWNSIMVRRAFTVSNVEVPQVDQYFARLECDHSTPAGRNDLLTGQAVAIFKELVGLARENAAEGELA